ncbi:response regulator [bacterium]|nr:response regulator [bacterium]
MEPIVQQYPSLNPHPSLVGRTILVVDDDAVVLNTIKMMLQSADINCILATDGQEALAAVIQQKPDVILLDYMMPGINGAEVYKKLLTDGSYISVRDTPVIMLTAKTDNYKEQQELLKMGLSAYLLKPFGHKELINVIINVLTLNDVKIENQKLQVQLQDIKNYLQSVFDSITDPISVQNVHFQIQRFNHAAARAFPSLTTGIKSFESESPVPLHCHQLFFNHEKICDNCPASETLATGQSKLAEIQHDNRFYQISTYPVHDRQGRVISFVESIKDITEKKMLENQLIESSKLASIGTLAAGVAHEINNPLCIILGFTQSLLTEIGTHDPVRKELEIIEHETARCGKVVQDLLAYARPGELVRSLTSVIELMQGSIGLIRHLLKKNKIVLTESYESNIPDSWMDAPKMRQVFINMLLNAIQAMPDGGTIDVTINYDSDNINIRFTDTGAGIPGEKIPFIFDPFFTTKKGQGSGLGLSICKAIIHEHQGTISVQSHLGKGTQFLIILPVLQN